MKIKENSFNCSRVQNCVVRLAVSIIRPKYHFDHLFKSLNDYMVSSVKPMETDLILEFFEEIPARGQLEVLLFRVLTLYQQTAEKF